MKTRFSQLLDIPLDKLLSYLFGIHRNAPEKMPKDTPFVPSFTMRHPIGWSNFVLLTAVLVLMCIIAYFVDHIATTLLCVCTVIGSLGTVLTEWSIRIRVTEESVEMRYLLFLHKKVRWAEVRCVRVIRQSNIQLTYIVLYGADGKSLIDVSSSICNFWLLAKMAEHLNIKIRKEKDLPLKQMRHL